MDGEVQQVIAEDVRTIESVVKRQGKVDEGPAVNGGSAVTRRGQGIPDRPKMADGRVLVDRADVVEDEGDGETVEIGEEAGKDDDRCGQFDGSACGRRGGSRTRVH